MAVSCPICFDASETKASYTRVSNHSWRNSDRCDAHGVCQPCLQQYVEVKLFDEGVWHIRCPGIGCHYHLLVEDVVAALSDPERRELGITRHAQLRDQTCTVRLEEIANATSVDPSVKWLLEQCQVCPRCFVIARKEDGCRHLVCRCSCNYCFGCGAPYDEDSCLCHNDDDFYDDWEDEIYYGLTDRFQWQMRQLRWQQRELEHREWRRQNFGRWLRVTKQHPAFSKMYSRGIAEIREVTSERLAALTKERDQWRRELWDLEFMHGVSGLLVPQVEGGKVTLVRKQNGDFLPDGIPDWASGWDDSYPEDLQCLDESGYDEVSEMACNLTRASRRMQFAHKAAHVCQSKKATQPAQPKERHTSTRGNRRIQRIKSIAKKERSSFRSDGIESFASGSLDTPFEL